MTYPDPDLDWVAILEAQGAGPEKYHVHATNHQMACQKYAVAAKQAKEAGNKERASLLRKIGKKHKAAAEALLAIANHHTDALYGIQLKKKAQLMPKKQPVNEETLEESKVDDHIKATLKKHGWHHENSMDDGDYHTHTKYPEHYIVHSGSHNPPDERGWSHLPNESDDPIAVGTTHRSLQKHLSKFHGIKEEIEVIDEEIEIEEDTRVRDLIGFVLEEKAFDFTRLVHEIIGERISDELDGLQDALREAIGAESDGSDEDDEEDSKESPEIQGESVEEIDEDHGRKTKRFLRKMGMDDHIKHAYDKGNEDGHFKKPRRNSYPKGKRRDEYDRGYDANSKSTNEGYRYAETEPGPAGGTHVVGPMGMEKEPDPTASAKKFPTGRQDGDKNKKLTQGTRKSGTKSSPGTLGDEDRLQNSRN